MKNDKRLACTHIDDNGIETIELSSGISVQENVLYPGYYFMFGSDSTIELSKNDIYQLYNFVFKEFAR